MFLLIPLYNISSKVVTKRKVSEWVSLLGLQPLQSKKPSLFHHIALSRGNLSLLNANDKIADQHSGAGWFESYLIENPE